MREKLLNFLVKLYLKGQNLAKLRYHVAGIVSFLIFAVIGYTLVWMGFERLDAIKTIRKEIVRLENSLTSVGYDLAYEDLDFSSFNPFQIMSVKNLQFYSRIEGQHAVWTLPELSLKTGLFNSRKITFNMPGAQLLELGEKKYNVSMPEVFWEFRLDDTDRLMQSIFLAKNVNWYKEFIF